MKTESPRKTLAEILAETPDEYFKDYGRDPHPRRMRAPRQRIVMAEPDSLHFLPITIAEGQKPPAPPTPNHILLSVNTRHWYVRKEKHHLRRLLETIYGDKYFLEDHINPPTLFVIDAHVDDWRGPDDSNLPVLRAITGLKELIIKGI